MVSTGFGKRTQRGLWGGLDFCEVYSVCLLELRRIVKIDND